MDIQVRVKGLRFASPQAFLERLAAGGPSTRHALAQVPEHAQRALVDDVSAALHPYMDAEGLTLPHASHVFLARP